MGYTHYWNAPKDFNREAWQEICEDIQKILTNTQHVQGIALANGMGDAGSQPKISSDGIALNGVGDDSHESFHVWRKRPAKESWERRKGNDFCKTAQKPYDLAVTACLSYLESVHGWRVSSDGDGVEWLAGVELAKQALPRYANQLDIPLVVRKDDRWNRREQYSLGFSNNKSNFHIGLCLDGHVYVCHSKNESICYRFADASEAAEFFKGVTEKKFRPRGDSRWPVESLGQPLFATSGSYDKKRHTDLRRDQNRVLRTLIDLGKITGRNIPPPAFARPKIMLRPGQELPANLESIYDLL